MMMKEMSMIQIVEHLLHESNEPIALKTIFDEVSKIKNFGKNDYEKLNQLYLDIVLSAKFVYMGEGMWDLKERNLEYWSKDSTDFASESEVDESELDGYKEVRFANISQEKVDQILAEAEALEEEEDLGLDFAEEDLGLEALDLDEEELDELEQLDEDERQARLEEKQYIADDLEMRSIEDDEDIDLDFDDYDDDFDEEDYHEKMDAYEDLY